MPTNGQFWYVTQGNPADARLAWLDVNASSASGGSNTNGATTVVVDNNPTTDLQTSFPEDVQLDWAAGLYFVVVNGNPALGTGGKILEGQIGSTAAPTVVYTAAVNDAINTIQIDQYSHHLYLGDLEQAGNPNSTGIRDFTYDPITGAFAPVATNNGFLVKSNQQTAIANDPGVGVPVFDPRDFALDHSTNQLFWVNETDGGAFTNQIYWLNLSTPTVLHPLLQQSQFPFTTDGSPYTNGYITSVEVDPTTDLVYFTTHSQHPSPDATYNAATDKIYWISESATGSTAATALTITGLPGGGHFYPGKITFDLDTRQIYVVSEETDAGTPASDADDVVYVLQLSADGHSASLVNSIFPSPAFGGIADNISGLTFDELAQLSTLSATNTHAAEQSTNVTLLTAPPTITDINGDHLNNATVKITGGTFVSNETSANDDHLSVAGQISGLISGTNITVTWTSATETLLLDGYDTLANYQSVLAQIQYDTTGDNPTNYGNNPTRTVTWQVNDGAAGDPTGTVDGTTTNARTTTLNIDAKNDAPVNHLPGSASVNEDVQTAITGISITDVDADPANQDITVTFSVVHGTLNINTAVAGGVTGGDITAGAQNTTFITLTATQNQINATLAGNGLRYTSDLNFNSGFGTETLNIATNDNSHTDSAAFPGAQTDTDDLIITVNAVNDNPNLQPDTTTPVSYIENAVPTALFAGENVDTPLGDVDQPANYAGGSIDLNITAGLVTGDRIDLMGSRFVIVAGAIQDTANGNAVVGTINATNATAHVTISALTANATPSVVDALIKSFGFDSTSDNPGAGDRTVTLTFNDGGNTGSGGALTDAVTQTVNVTPVNDAPVSTTPVAHYAATEQVNLNLHGTGLSVSDVDGNSGSETVTLSVVQGIITLSAGNSGVGSISGSGTSSVTFSGTLTQLNALLSGSSTGTLIYNDPSDTPAASTTLTLLIHDNGNTGTGGDLSNSSNSTIDITAVNDTPNAFMSTDPYSATEQTTLVLKGTGMTVSDIDALGASERITISVGQGTLSVTVGDSGVTVFSGNGTSSVVVDGTLAQLNALLGVGGTSNLTYIDNTDNPAASTTLTLQINDQGNTGTGGALIGTDTSTINITAVNDGPTSIAPVAHYAATEQVNLDLHGTGLSVSDADGNSGSETVTLSVVQGIITLSAGNSGVGSISGSGTSSVTFSGTLTQLNALLSGSSTGTLIYNNPSDTPAASTTLTLLIHDNGNTGGGDLFSSATATIDITAVNDAPVATITPASYSATENITLNLKTNGLSVSDVDGGPPGSETVTLSVTEGTLHVLTGTSGAGVSGDGTSSVTITGTIAQINALLQTDGTSVVQYTNTNDNPSATATLTLLIHDNGNSPSGDLSASDTAIINITAQNDAPVATITPTEYDGSPNVVINLKNNGLSVSDVDGNAGSETVTLSVTSGTLTVTTGGSGAGVAGSGTSSVTITGTIAQINALLNTDGTSTVSFIDPVGGTKTLTLLIHDNGNTGGGDLSASDTASIVLDQPPVVDLNGAGAGTGATLAYTENGAATAIAPAGVTTDPDSTDFNGGSLTVHFSANGAAEDQLSILTDGTVTVSSGTVSVGGLAIGTVSGGANGADLVVAFNTADATPSAVSTLIEHIAYADNSDNPSTASRTVTFTVNDGDGSSGGDAATVTITAVNDGPAATITPTTYSATEQTSLNLKNNGLAVSDVDGNAGSETVTLSVTEGTLNVTAGGSGAGVAGSGTSSVTITGTVAQINALLNTDGTSAVSYIDNTDDPSASATLTLLIHDNGNTGTGGDHSASDTATINITSVNDAPGLTNVPATGDYTENAAPVTLGPSIFVTDPDPFPHGAPGGNGLFLSATVKISSGFVAGDELLVFDTTTATSATSGFYTGVHIEWNYDATTHILTLDSAFLPNPQVDTLVDYAHVLDNIQFASTSDDPTNGGANNTRTLQWQIQDAGGTANGGTDLSTTYTTTLTVHPTNDAPVAAITPTSYSATEQTTLNLKNNGLAVSDIDGNTGSETVTLSVGEGTLNVTAGGSGAGVAGSGTSSVTITGTAAQINALLNTDGTSAVSYIDNSDMPAASTTLTLLIHDNGHTGGGDLTSTDTATINITAVNDAPVFTGLDNTPTFVENGPPIVLDNNATLVDPDLAGLGNYAGSTLTLAKLNPTLTDPAFNDTFGGAGTLAFDEVDVRIGATVVGSYTQQDGVLAITFNSSATQANVNAVLQQLTYSNINDTPPASVDIGYTFSDQNNGSQGTGGVLSTTGHIVVNITPTNDPPLLFNVAPNAGYQPGTGGSAISPALVLSDPDGPGVNDIAGATVKIASGFLAGDQLFADVGSTGITASYNAGTHILTLSGVASESAYQQVLDTVVYSSTAADPTAAGADPNRTIEWQATDVLGAASTVQTTNINFVSGPTVDLDGSAPGSNYTTTYTENGAPLSVSDTDIVVQDTNSPTLNFAFITLTNAQDHDILSFSGLPSGITGSVDTSVPGQITVALHGVASAADYQTAIHNVGFSNSGDDPSTVDRGIDVFVGDNDLNSNTAHATVHVVAVNDAPVNALPSQSFAAVGTNTALTGIHVSDPDAENGSMSTTLSIDRGTLTLSSAGGASVSGSGTDTVVLTGTLDQINTSLSASGNFVYHAPGTPGPATLTMTTNDNGNTGIGGPLTDFDHIDIVVSQIRGDHFTV